MKRIITGIIICFLFANCNKKDTPKNSIYIISKENYKTIKILERKNIPPPPPVGGTPYGTHNFIFDNDTTIYYFQRREFSPGCGTGMENDTTPHFIDLQPHNLIQIPNNSITDFIKLNYKGDYNNATFISSKSDTLKSKAYFDLINALQLSLKHRDFYHIRRTTQEEDTVLHYKKSKKYYYSNQIKWDTTRIKLPTKN